MLSVVNSFFGWVEEFFSNPSVVTLLNSWIIQVPLLLIYVFRILHIFKNIVPDE